ncbi:MAG: RNA-binding protein [Candidatus Omnitrophica bacterium]|nr:RNA-binding protein [Candidatus Omnitrophota bacterium]
MNKKLYVGNLEYSTTEDELAALFADFGAVTSARVINGADGRPRGFGFVEMETEESAKNAMEKLNQSSFKNRTIVVNEAKEMKNRNFQRQNRNSNYDRRPKDDLNSKLRELRKKFS